MKILETNLAGVFVIEPVPVLDHRGLFARVWDADRLAVVGTNAPPAYCAVSFNAHRHTLRGMHLQRSPYQERKIVRCTAGVIFDVAVDLRSGSATWGSWTAAELSASNRRSLVIPEDCAHGFLTLEPGSEVEYLITGRYHAAACDGLRWDDPLVGIDWPAGPKVMSLRDAAYPLLKT